MQEGPAVGLYPPVEVEALEQRAEQRLGREEISLHLLAVPGGRRKRPAQQRPERVVLIGERTFLGSVYRARLEDRHVGAVAGHVLARSLQQRAEQRRAHDRLAVRERVLHDHDLAHRVIGRQTQAVEQRRLGEAPANDLVQPAPHERVLGRAPHALGVGEPAGRAAPCGQRGGQVL